MTLMQWLMGEMLKDSVPGTLEQTTAPMSDEPLPLFNEGASGGAGAEATWTPDVRDNITANDGVDALDSTPCSNDTVTTDFGSVSCDPDTSGGDQ